MGFPRGMEVNQALRCHADTSLAHLGPRLGRSSVTQTRVQALTIEVASRMWFSVSQGEPATILMHARYLLLPSWRNALIW